VEVVVVVAVLFGAGQVGGGAHLGGLFVVGVSLGVVVFLGSLKALGQRVALHVVLQDEDDFLDLGQRDAVEELAVLGVFLEAFGVDGHVGQDVDVLGRNDAATQLAPLAVHQDDRGRLELDSELDRSQHSHEGHASELWLALCSLLRPAFIGVLFCMS